MEMARGKAVVLSTRSFSNQTEAISYFQTMLNRYKPGDRVGQSNSLDHAALLEWRCEYTQKIGCGLESFSVTMTEHGTRCFAVIRTDGSGTEFSCKSPNPRGIDP
jgi:Protein of unknown function (DUF3223)